MAQNKVFDTIIIFLMSCFAGSFSLLILSPVMDSSNAVRENIAIATGLIVFFIVLVSLYISAQIDELKKLTVANLNPPKDKEKS